MSIISKIIDTSYMNDETLIKLFRSSAEKEYEFDLIKRFEKYKKTHDITKLAFELGFEIFEFMESKDKKSLITKLVDKIKIFAKMAFEDDEIKICITLVEKFKEHMIKEESENFIETMITFIVKNKAYIDENLPTIMKTKPLVVEDKLIDKFLNMPVVKHFMVDMFMNHKIITNPQVITNLTNLHNDLTELEYIKNSLSDKIKKVVEKKE